MTQRFLIWIVKTLYLHYLLHVNDARISRHSPQQIVVIHYISLVIVTTKGEWHILYPWLIPGSEYFHASKNSQCHWCNGWNSHLLHTQRYTPMAVVNDNHPPREVLLLSQDPDWVTERTMVIVYPLHKRQRE